MNNEITIGIVGFGFVGRAVAYGFNKQKLVIADPVLGTSTKDIVNANCDVVFICVPTPMSDDGSIDSSIVENVISELKELKNSLIVLKSTVTPNIVKVLSNTINNFVYNPEFLTERNANHDFEFPRLHVFGGSPEATSRLSEIYFLYSICEPSPTFFMSATEASFVKYGINTFLATKVLFWNQFKDQCDKMGADYEEIIAAISTDDRIGGSHMSVPGHDGKRGFGGACFTKDTAAFSTFSQNEFTLLNEAIKANNAIRSQYTLCAREAEQNVRYG